MDKVDGCAKRLACVSVEHARLAYVGATVLPPHAHYVVYIQLFLVCAQIATREVKARVRTVKRAGESHCRGARPEEELAHVHARTVARDDAYRLKMLLVVVCRHELEHVNACVALGPNADEGSRGCGLSAGVGRLAVAGGLGQSSLLFARCGTRR